MSYNFDQCIDRRGTDSAKFDEQDWKYGCTDMIHLGVADMDFRSPEPIIDAMRGIVDRGVFGYTVLPRNYRSLTAEWMKRRYGVEIRPEWAVFSPRINMAMNMAVETFTSSSDGIVLHTPAYTALQNAIEKYDRPMIESPLELSYKKDEDQGGIRQAHEPSWHMNLSALRASLDRARENGTPARMMLFCNPQNPTGRVWRHRELRQVAELCREYGLLLISDEIHADFIRPGFCFTSMLEFRELLDNRLIVCNSVTKTFNVPGLILSNLIIPDPSIRRAMESTIDRWGLHNPNIFAAGIMEAAFTGCDDWIEEVNAYLEGNRLFVEEYLKSHLPKFQVIPAEGTYLLWVSVKELHKSPEEIEEFFTCRARVSVYMGSRYGRRTRDFIRLNIASPRSVLEEAMERIQKAYAGWS